MVEAELYIANFPDKDRHTIKKVLYSPVEELKEITQDWSSGLKGFTKAVLKSDKNPEEKRKMGRMTYQEAINVDYDYLKFWEIVRAVIWSLPDPTLERIIESFRHKS